MDCKAVVSVESDGPITVTLAGCHDYGGDDDSFFLNNSSELLEAAMADLTDPPASAEFVFIDNGGHGASPHSTTELLTIMYDAMIADRP